VRKPCSRLAIWQSAGGFNWATTVIKTLVPFSNVTPPKTPPHKKSLSKELYRNFKSKNHRLKNGQKFALLKFHLPTAYLRSGKQKQKLT
jgi:hypothetical protein